MKPLEGLRVLELSQALSAPFCGMMLADMGADIIKLERPPIGDSARYNAPGKNGVTPTFSGRNRGKKSVLMDLSDPKQKEFFFEMVKSADIILENFKPGTMEKFGCDYETLKKLNSGIILTSISGFGQTGPMKKRAAYDVVIQAESGFMSVTGTKKGELVSVGYSIADCVAGLTACAATLAALRGREITGEGQHVDISMLDSLIATMETPFGGYVLTGDVPKTQGVGHPLAAPFSVFDTKDGRKLLICINAEAQWAKLCEIMNKSEWVMDKRYQSSAARKSNEEELITEMSPIIASWNKDELVEVMTEKGIAYGNVCSVDQVVDSEQFKVRDMLCRVHYPDCDTSMNVIGSAIKMSGYKNEDDYTAYSIGYHTISECSKFMGKEKAHEIYDSVLKGSHESSLKAQKKAGII